MYKGAFLKQSRGRFLFSPPLPLPIFFSRLNFRAITRSETLATHARFPSFVWPRNGYLPATQSKVTPKCIIPIYPDAHVTPKSRPSSGFWHLHISFWCSRNWLFMLAPDWMLGVIFHSPQYKWARTLSDKRETGPEEKQDGGSFCSREKCYINTRYVCFQLVRRPQKKTRAERNIVLQV